MEDENRVAVDGLEADISAWVDEEVHKDPASVPDFWDDMDTSNRLATFLSAAGYRKVAP